METVNKLEVTIAEWYKNAPHLPPEGQKWLAENAWWLALVGVILEAIGIVSLVFVTLLAGALLAGYGGPVGTAVGGIAFLGVLVAVAFSVVVVVLGAMAITPLKALRKKGWTLLFIIMLLNVVSVAASFLFSYNLFGVIWGLLFIAVGGYFLFEIRDYYGKKETIKLTTKPVTKKASQSK